MLPTFSIGIHCRPFATACGFCDRSTLAGRGFFWRTPLITGCHWRGRRRDLGATAVLVWSRFGCNGSADTARRITVLFGFAELDLYTAVPKIMTTASMVLLPGFRDVNLLSLSFAVS